MDGDASAENVMAVFDAYDDDIDDGDVGGIAVILDGPKRATLSAGAGMHVTQQMADELVGVQHDISVIEYRREAYPVLPSVHLTLAPTGFDTVGAVAHRYRDADDIELVEVVSGDFTLNRDEANEDVRLTDAREEFAHRVDSQFHLRGAVVSGRGPLQLFVAPADEAAARRLAARHPGAKTLGDIVVRPAR